MFGRVVGSKVSLNLRLPTILSSLPRRQQMGHVIYFFLTRLLWRRNIMSSPPRRVWRLDGTGLLSATMTSQNPFAAWSSGLATLYNTFLPYSHLFLPLPVPLPPLPSPLLSGPFAQSAH